VWIETSAYQEWAIALFRLLLGIGILIHGLPKLFHPQVGLLGQRGFAGFLGSLGFPVPVFWQVVAVVVEVGGGIAIVLGVVTQLATALLFLEMLVATYVSAIRLKQPFPCVDSKGWEIDVFYAIGAVLLFVCGPGAFALDPLLWK